MPSDSDKHLPDEMFLVEVKDPSTGSVARTLDAMNSPAMLLSFTANHFTEGASRYFKELFGLGAVDWRILFLIASDPGSTGAQASKTIGVDKGAVSRSLQKLEDEGLLVPGELHANGRSRGWHLTKQGHRLHKKLVEVALPKQKELLYGFKHREVVMFSDFLRRVLVNTDAMRLSDEGETKS